MKTVNILGTEYSVEHRTEKQDSHLREADGYCDKTTCMVVIADRENESDLGDYGQYQRKVTRHELIHAFLFESGLHQEFGHDEVTIDWFAVQFPKIMKAFKEAGCAD